MRSHQKKPLQRKTTALLPSVSNGIARGAPATSNISEWSATGATRPRSVPTRSNHSTFPHIPNRAGVTHPSTPRAVSFVTEGAKCFTEAHTSSGISVPQSAFDYHIIDDSDNSLNTESSEGLSPSQGSEVHCIPYPGTLLPSNFSHNTKQ